MNLLDVIQQLVLIGGVMVLCFFVSAWVANWAYGSFSPFSNMLRQKPKPAKKVKVAGRMYVSVIENGVLVTKLADAQPATKITRNHTVELPQITWAERQKINEQKRLEWLRSRNEGSYIPGRFRFLQRPKIRILLRKNFKSLTTEKKGDAK